MGSRVARALEITPRGALPAPLGSLIGMSATYIGSMNLASAIPGFSSAVSGLQGALSQLDAFKADKEDQIARALVDFEPIFNLFNTAKTLIEDGQALLAQATSIAEAARAIVGDLLSTIGGAGVGLYRYSGDVTTLGRDLQECMRANGQQGDVEAIILVASDGGAFEAVRKIFNLG